MADYKRLEASAYVVQSYVEVSELWRRYEDSGKAKHARAAASLLCDTLRRLSGDQEFWSLTIDAVGEIDGPEAEAVREVLEDLSEFRRLEEDALRNLGVPSDQASRLSSDLINAIRMAEGFPDGASITNLQSRVGDLGARICEVADASHGWKRLVSKGMRVLGGAAATVVDGVTIFPIPVLAVLSIGGGVILMGLDAFDE